MERNWALPSQKASRQVGQACSDSADGAPINLLKTGLEDKF